MRIAKPDSVLVVGVSTHYFIKHTYRVQHGALSLLTNYAVRVCTYILKRIVLLPALDAISQRYDGRVSAITERQKVLVRMYICVRGGFYRIGERDSVSVEKGTFFRLKIRRLSRSGSRGWIAVPILRSHLREWIKWWRFLSTRKGETVSKKDSLSRNDRMRNIVKF